MPHAIFNSDSNSDNDDNENTGSSFAQYNNENNNDSDSNSNSETFITLSDLTKEQELKWFSDNDESIMSEHVHDTDAGFDLKYPEKETIKLKPNLHTFFNSDSNSDNDDNENTGSSFAQYNNENNNDSDSNSNSETFITLSDLTKEQELKWFSDNDESIMSEHVHDTDAGFDLKYPEKETIKLKPNLHTCIDLKIALKILTTIIVQLAFRSKLAKKRINIRGGIIDMRYVENIIAMLQNDSKKTYIIELNEKIAQTIFLPLVKIAQLVSVRKRKELDMITRGIQRFGSMNRIDISVNMAKKEIIYKEKIISTHQLISIPQYNQYMLAIKKKVKNQAQLFEAEATICKSGEIGLTNLYILAKSPKNIKIPIYNTIESVIEIPKRTIIGYLTTKVEDQLPNHIPDFPQLCEYMDITSQIIYKQSKCYLLQSEQLKQINIKNLDPLQQIQLKMLLSNFNDIFASKNEFGHINIIQPQIKTEDAMPIKQRTY
ncbi:hypothetical protein G9A89_016426 [Geosiphon pyriformis]|nr:hypothetical protein G9A89_016426 [Geosiphon pyriformis]